MKPAINIHQLSKTYNGTNAVDDLSLTIESGEFFGILGHNGAGKTTTINCITGITKFTEGRIEVFGTDVVKDYKDARKLIGLSPQEFNADIFAPAEKIVDYVGGYFGMRKADRAKRLDVVFDMLNLQEHRKKSFRELSGGLKRRLILARALIHDPKLLILDEPTAGIDVEQRHALWKQLEELHAGGKTIILTSHYLEEVERLCSRAAIMHKGKLARILTREEFKDGGNSLEETYLKITGSLT